MNKLKFVTLLYALIILPKMHHALADPMPPERVLRKASLALTGTVPTRSESNEFKAQWKTLGAATALQNFAQKVKSQAQNQLIGFYGSWFRTGPTEGARTAAWYTQTDRPFLEVLTTPYILADDVVAGRYSPYIPNMSVPFGVTGSWELAKFDDPKFHGVLSRLDFLTRFPDTPTNKLDRFCLMRGLPAN